MHAPFSERLTWWRLVVLAVGSCQLCSTAIGAAAEPPPIRLRVEWGGGDNRAWQGRLELVQPAASPWRGRKGSDATQGLQWRLLSGRPAAVCGLRQAGNALIIADEQPQPGSGVELSIGDWRSSRLRLTLRPTDAGQDEPEVVIDQPVASLLAAGSLQPLDSRGNRLTIGPAPGELLRLRLTSRSPAGQQPPSEAWGPGQPVRLTVHPLLPARPSGFGTIDLRLVLANRRTGEELLAHTLPLAPSDESPPELGDSLGLQAGQSAFFDFQMPAVAGVYRLSVEAIERGRLRWSRTLVSRTVEFPVVASPAKQTDEDNAAWQVIYRLDPGSPRLHERLRRLPGQAAESMAAMRRLSLPAMPMPSLTRATRNLPTLQLPKVSLPELPALPRVPAIDSLVPNFGGLLATGDSTVEPHPLGAMLRLPPAATAAAPTWEGIVVAEAVPGLPHAVELEYPSDQQATVGVSVLERDPAGGAVVQRYDGGFQVPRPFAAAAPELRRHRFVFWPQTRAPVIVITNPSPQRSVTIGQVRVLTGPKRLARQPGDRPAGPRKIYAQLPRRANTAVDPGGPGTAGTPTDWVSWYDELQQATASLAIQQADGVAVDVFAAGAGLWQSAATATGPRWNGQPHAPTQFWNGGDRLSLLRQACRAAGLGLIPQLRFDGPLAALERHLDDPATATGLLCIGRDGRSRDAAATRGGRHYNVLDPRVQDAVAAVATELVDRLAATDGVEGIAVVLAADGWLHLPGVTWGLDDRTFARFARETGLTEELPAAAGPDRYAARAAAVEGRLREAWLTWRTEQVAALHTRLAGIVAAADAGWSYSIMPTTLLFDGEVGQRFRPDLAGQPPADDLLRELGLDPGRLTRAANAVYVAASLHAATDGLATDMAIATANRSPAVAAWERRARRRGLVLLEQQRPLDLVSVIPHGPFGTTEFAGHSRLHAVAGGPARQQLLVQGLATHDAEIIFDQSLFWAELSDTDRASWQAFRDFPAGPLQRLDGMPAGFPVWSRQHGKQSWLLVGNGSRLPARIEMRTAEPVTAAIDLVSGEPLAGGQSRLVIDLPAGSLRGIRVEGAGVAAPPERATVRFDEQAVRLLADQVAALRHREAVLLSPPAVPVLDNPGFELPSLGDGLTGWELVAAAAGDIELVECSRPAADAGTENRAARFSSVSDLATIRSNPFPAPATGRASVAVWLRLPEDAAQPPLRVAVEGLADGEEYYRFAPVGAAAGGRPLAPEWTRFVLQVGDLPTGPTQSLRLRFDMLGPGVVEIDEIQVVDLVLPEMQRAELQTLLDQLEHDLAVGAVGRLPAALDGYLPRFLQLAVSDEQAAAAAQRLAQRTTRTAAAEPTAPAETAEQPTGLFDRVRSWWR